MKRSNYLIIWAVCLLMGLFFRVSMAQVNQMQIYQPYQGEVVDWHCQQLRWVVVPSSPTVYVKISIDLGKTWQDLKHHEPGGTTPIPENEAWNDGYLTYETPHVWTKQAIIRLINRYDLSDYTDSKVFAIRHTIPESLVVTHPQAGDSFVAGSAAEISWHTNHPTAYEYDIELSTDGQQTWSMICEQAYNDGYYYWRIPPDLESDNCYIRLYSDLHGWGHTDTTGPFRITKNTQATYLEDVSLTAGLDLEGSYRCVSWVDLNQDAYLDLFISGTEGYPNLSYLNNRDGTFSKGFLQADVEDTEGYNRAAVFGDINNDGYPDLYLGGGNGFYDKLFLNNGDGTFENITSQAGIGAFSQETNGVSFLDYDLDGDLDIYVCKNGMHNLLYRNEGNITFTDVSAIAGVEGIPEAGTSAVAVGDYNRDRYPDLYVVNSGNEGNKLYNNNGDGTFSDVTHWPIGLEWSNSKTAEWGDFNNDGLLDLYVVRKYSSNRLFQYNYNGLFTDITDQAQVGDTGEGVVLSIGDLDGDGRQDICVGNSGQLLFYLQNSEGAFDEQSSLSGLVSLDEPRGMALGDYDNDGDLDLFVVNWNGPSKLFENKYTDISENHYLKVRLEGVMSNKDAIGARVLIFHGYNLFHGDTNRQVREVQAGKGYGDCNSLEVEFGLGSFDFIDNMMIFWPSGIVQTFSDLFVDSLYCIREIPEPDPEENPDALTVMQPIEGATFQSGTIESISWETAGNIEQVLLEYSTDGGKLFQPITIAGNSGLFDWSIPHNIASDSCCIRIADAEDGSPADTSGLFRLEIPIISFHWDIGMLEQKAGDSFWITLNLGNEEQQVYSMMNLSGGGQFSMPVYVNIVPDSFVLGPMWGNNPWIDIEIDTLLGQFSFSLQRSVGEGGFHGFGEVARILFRSKFNTPDSMEMVVKLDSLSLKDTAWTDIPIYIDSLTISILNDGLIVWPGDTDNNGIVNQKDVLPLGLYWEVEGPMRSGLSLDWIGQKCVPWMPDCVTYSDGNGDGQVDAYDLTAIEQNWSQQHDNGHSVFPLGQQASVGKIYLQVADHEPYAPFSTDILINGEANLYGMALNFCYYQEKIEIDSVEIGSLWGGEVLFLYSDNADTGEVGIGISLKTVQQGQSANGLLARVWMRVKQDVPLNQPVIFRIEDLLAVNASGERLLVTTENDGFITDVSEPYTQKPLTFQLYSNYPNPFNPSTVISYDIPKDVPVLLRIYDILGHEVRTLVNKEQKSGHYAIEWDSRDDNGLMVSSGIYIYKIIAGDHMSTKKCMLMK
ncbi:VCBS repeat-containing protein [bacterium]|nr:VCBS repeat-containing protein [bacterium]RQV94736.1 MAG: T9SS C-terminal target domain-containing protein [bacterium]